MTAARPANGARILVVDDVEDNRDLLVRRLKRDGYSDIATAEDGLEALALLDKRDFDLVLLDIMMPRCNGYEVLEAMDADRRLSEVPVVVLSAQNEIDSVVRCVELGAIDYLHKPFTPVLLRARMRATLEKKRLRDEEARHLVRLEQELAAGRKLQLAMVPNMFPPPTPENPVEVFAMMEPAREVGGDLYDFFTTESGIFCFLVGDVSGKGVASALVMARTMALVRTLASMEAGGGQPRPGDILARVNHELCVDNDTMMFVTLFLAMLNASTGELWFCNAGHEPPLRLRDRGIDRLQGTRAMALGVMPDADYASDRVVLETGESLYVFTDGITEATGADGAMFTEAAIVSVLRERGKLPLEEMVCAVSDALSAFVGDKLPFDDVTALAVRRLS